MKLSLIALVSAVILFSTAAFAEPVEGPISGTADVDPGQTLVQPVELLRGQTYFRLHAEGGDIRCGLFNTDGETIVVDDRGGNSCAFHVELKEAGVIILAVANKGDTVAHVTAVAQ